MKTKHYSRFISMLLVVILLLGSFATTAYASDISSFLTDTTTGWAKYSSNSHMGSKSSAFTYASDDVKETYSEYVEEGIDLWGSYITCSESSSTSAMGEFTVSDMDSGANAVTDASYYTSTGHRSSWTITIYSVNFDGNSDEGKYRTIAHEIGHAYGLHHVSDSSKIMYGTYSASKNVTSTDRAGMRVMTHAHTHSSSYSKTYEQYTSTKHKVRCNSCKAYLLESCTSDCVCGNN